MSGRKCTQQVFEGFEYGYLHRQIIDEESYSSCHYYIISNRTYCERLVVINNFKTHKFPNRLQYT